MLSPVVVGVETALVLPSRGGSHQPHPSPPPWSELPCARVGAAQLGERSVRKAKVGSSILLLFTTLKSQLLSVGFLFSQSPKRRGVAGGSDCVSGFRRRGDFCPDSTPFCSPLSKNIFNRYAVAQTESQRSCGFAPAPKRAVVDIHGDTGALSERIFELVVSMIDYIENMRKLLALAIAFLFVVQSTVALAGPIEHCCLEDCKASSCSVVVCQACAASVVVNSVQVLVSQRREARLPASDEATPYDVSQKIWRPPD
jgi:hypothetical protein